LTSRAARIEVCAAFAEPRRSRETIRLAAKHGHSSQRDLWNERATAWERWEPALMNGLAAVNPVLFRALDLEPGQRVLDLGCGTGDPALGVAQWVGARGHVLGIDNSDAMLAVAKRRARLLELRSISFRRGDMNRLRPLTRRVQRAVARYSLMFADDIVAVLRALRASLMPRGILAAAVWGPLEKNPAVTVREEAARPFRSEPPPDPETTPNPMRLACRGLLTKHFLSAGFRDVRTAAVPVATVYSSLEEVARIQMGSSLAELCESLTPADLERLRERLESGFGPFLAGPVVRVPAHAWVVSGRR
jgi:SAM-dependent methyltransferase